MSPNISIGTGLKLYCKLAIQTTGRVTIGSQCIVSGVPGDRRHYVTIETLNPDAVVSIGDSAALFAARISARFSIEIGDNVTIEESSITDTDFHSLTPDRGEPRETPEKCRVHIGNKVLVGARSMILKGVSIGDNSLILPGAIVTRDVPSGCVIAGNPARPIKRPSAT